MFKTNVGGADRILRIVIGLALIAWFIFDRGEGFWHWAKLIGIVPLLTGLMSTCPVYSILGISTCPMKQS
jgi:drug/metabolite transporter (DMT)-like permease